MTDAREKIVIELAGAPRGKGRPRFARATGRAYTPAHTRSFQDALRYAAQEVMNGQSPLEGPITIVMVAIIPIPSSWSEKKRRAAREGHIWPTVKPDGDNILKQTDALNQIVFVDDKQIVDQTGKKRWAEPGREGCRITITVY